MSAADCTYGLSIVSRGSGPERFAAAADLARAADGAGFDALWTSELYDRSATILMAHLAGVTTHARIGSSIAYGVGRTPLMWAAEARDLDELSGGRLALGLGNGTSRMMSEWHGVDGSSPAVRMEELVVVLRKLWRLHEGPVRHDGRFYHVDVAPPAATLPPLREHLPIYTAGVNPRMIETAGRVADGVVGHPMFTAAYVDEVVRPAVAVGAKKRDRDPGDVETIGILMCAVHDDEDVARRRIAFSIAQYAASRVYDRLFEIHGWEDAQLRIRAAAKARDVDAQIAAVPDDAVDAIGVACRPGELAGRVAAHAVSYDHLDLTGPAWGLQPEEQEHAQRLIVEGMAPVLGARVSTSS
ncbi:LLM class flavin-dependent oxidoreductase [Patulibacter minatonensis]|uniref:LLM class flavin-dependent oxidoreductase n=1 Tax=Patulibacter minatonensis TaxID=298163 RepID=UPI00047CF1BE|nr:LLM class flavin-dependent oxidoreductase [Patulibacter minatonensis]